ncbi:MAG: SDR family NAD(P)-dependent oxidoreductase [Cellvibrio sp.]
MLYRNLQLPYPAWEVELSDAFFPYIKDHKIGNKIILPGAFYVEAALALNEKISGERVGSLKNLSFERILALPDEKSEEEKRIISMCTPDKKVFKIYSTTTALEETWAFHMRGEIAPAIIPDADVQALNKSFDDFHTQDIPAFYKTVAENGLQYGPYFQPIKTLKNKDDVVYAELENTLVNLEGDYILSPAILDGVFQTLFAFGGQYKVPFIPVQIERLAMYGKVTSRCKVVGKLLWMSAKSLKADFVLFDEDNQPIAELKGVVCQALSQMGTSDQKNVGLYRTSWEILDTDELETRELANETVVIISNTLSESTFLQEQLAVDNKVILIEKNNFNRADFSALLARESVDKLIYLCEAPVALDQALEHSVDHCARLTDIVQVFSDVYAAKSVELFIGTRHACKVLDSDSVEGVASSSLAGFGRTINTEYSNIKCSNIDFTHGNVQEQKNFYDFVLCAEAGIKELAIRGTRIYQHTLLTLEQEEKELETIESRIGQRIVIADFSGVENNALPFSAAHRVLPEGSASSDENRIALQANEIEFEVDYLTLSYWDQLNSQLAIYPEDPEKHFFKYQAGMQSVGEVVNKGSAVTDFAVGDQVLSLFPQGITNFTTLNAKYAFAIPEQLHHQHLPDVYEIFRARYAVSTIGNPRQGSRLLIKGCWGAFVQTLLADAKVAGLNIIFVDEQSSALVQHEVEAIADVHYLAAQGNWASEVMRITNGVDIFINHGWQDLENLHLLNAFGKAIDFKSAQIVREHLSFVPALNATYHVIDIDSLFSSHFDFVRLEIEKILLALASGTLSLPTLPVFDLNNIAAAAVELKSGVAAAVQITMNRETVPLLLETKADELVLEGTYIVSGGTQGFGLQCAEWLVEKGALNIVLISRSGLNNAEAIKTVSELQQNGINVKVCALDVTNIDRVKEEFAQIKNSMPPVKGIIHSAMVLDDAYLSQLNAARFQRVLSPKIQGAINLHLALQDTPLDFFVMFSSISSLIGNAGQGNYVAANSFLDGFAHYLSSRGVAAKTINWGALSDTGVLAHNDSLVKVLELAGIHGVTNLQAMTAMESVLTGSASQTGIFHVDWNQWATSNPSLSQSNFYRELLTQQDQSAERQKLMEVLENIINKDSEGRKAYIQQELAVRFGAIFKMAPESISPHASIIDLGVDSLMSVEISMALKTQLGVDIPTIELISGPSIAILATKILTQLEALIDEVLREQADAEEPTALEM